MTITNKNNEQKIIILKALYKTKKQRGIEERGVNFS